MPSFKKQLQRLVLLTAFTCWAIPSSADDTTHSPSLAPFSATYEIDWDGGLSLSGSTTRELKQDAKQQNWLFHSKASAMFASIEESSRFIWQDQQLHPLRYKFKRSVLGKKRTADVSFDWDKKQVTNTVEDKPWKMDISDGVQDKISYQLLLQREVAQGKTEFNYSVADGGKLKHYRFSVDGKEVIKAPIGEYDAIRVKRIREEKNPRQTLIWFAPELDYQIIKLQQIEKKDKSYTLLLKTLNQ
ncbi:DUF3108 domain-containing protein [Neptuniibacter sp.]|uniref:DUF3108 domain-containing protein n=1 Tax=Neptuniibacter sp. TaxID=1962643 RepID=UPI0026133EB1|nr:DUF3108 domain-containing protein [Neptuniibacter sp.]MCP4594887.1 DUF3108 domain-containing protein [Neptuniibacter sp.]